MDRSIESHFLNLYAMALCDTQFDIKELNVILTIAKEKGVDELQFREVLLNPDKVQFQVPESMEKKIEYLYDYARVILADGKIESNEDHTFRLICSRFGFDSEYIDDIIAFLYERARNQITLNDVLDEAMKLTN